MNEAVDQGDEMYWAQGIEDLLQAMHRAKREEILGEND
jgi:hypothetical protein